MNDLFDAMQNDFDELIKAAEELCCKLKNNRPEVKTQRKNADAELLQKDQNLAEDIDIKLGEVNALKNEEAKHLWAVTDIREKIRKIQSEINNLKSQREDIHKQWISSHSVKTTTVKPMCRPDLRRAYKILANMFDAAVTEKEYKRFDNLCHNRNQCITMFGYDWDIQDVYNELSADDPRLAEQIYDFNKFCADNLCEKK